jgi:cell wall-associated NlpC family hydrolase
VIGPVSDAVDPSAAVATPVTVPVIAAAAPADDVVPATRPVLDLGFARGLTPSPLAGALRLGRTPASRSAARSLSAARSRAAARNMPVARTPQVAPALLVRLVEDRPGVNAPAVRSAVRRSAKPRPRQVVSKTRPEATRRVREARNSITRGMEQRGTVRRATSQRGTKQQATTQRTVRQHSGPRPTRRASTAPRGLSAVVAYARAQVGKGYAGGGAGPNAFDCSGLTMQAYRRIGLRLPHSSGGQAARARNVSRSHARPGDLVVGPGHVGVYMGGGMMVDAGNSRVGVVFRPLYAGLHIERF